MAALPPEFLTTQEVLFLCGINDPTVINGIIEDMLSSPEGIMYLQDEDADGIQSACSGYARRTISDGNFTLRRVRQKRLISLMHWVNDKHRLAEPAGFPIGTTQLQFTEAIQAANERKQCRVDQKKKGESLLTNDFQVKLEAANQWERWLIELQSTLKIIIGAKGIALDYVIRQNDMPDLSDQSNWEERARLVAPHSGNTYRLDALAVNGVILRNIAEFSDAYTYAKTYIRQYYGRVDITVLRTRYENSAMQDGQCQASLSRTCRISNWDNATTVH